ncbi:unnamed protein product [Trichogramma brassicae]|uniref:Uncharacterized protein n=1 Tax=Trichogramma brassicae TaxID=86971 RepID=A0A6H5IH13_9HYME|nr:unnamed protein product [Trichogramma brassicae]
MKGRQPSLIRDVGRGDATEFKSATIKKQRKKRGRCTAEGRKRRSRHRDTVQQGDLANYGGCMRMHTPKCRLGNVARFTSAYGPARGWFRTSARLPRISFSSSHFRSHSALIQLEILSSLDSRHSTSVRSREDASQLELLDVPWRLAYLWRSSTDSVPRPFFKRAKANVNAKDCFGNNPMFCALMRAVYDFYNTNFYLTDFRMRPVAVLQQLKIVVRTPNFEAGCIKADLAATNRMGQTLMHFILDSDREEINLQPYIEVVRWNEDRVAIVEFLLEQGAPVDTLDYYNDSLLQVAMNNFNYRAVDVLLNYEADLKIVRFNRQTFQRKRSAFGYYKAIVDLLKTIEILESRGYKLNEEEHELVSDFIMTPRKRVVSDLETFKSLFGSERRSGVYYNAEQHRVARKVNCVELLINLMITCRYADGIRRWACAYTRIYKGARNRFSQLARPMHHRRSVGERCARASPTPARCTLEDANLGYFCARVCVCIGVSRPHRAEKDFFRGSLTRDADFREREREKLPCIYMFICRAIAAGERPKAKKAKSPPADTATAARCSKNMSASCRALCLRAARSRPPTRCASSISLYLLSSLACARPNELIMYMLRACGVTADGRVAARGESSGSAPGERLTEDRHACESKGMRPRTKEHTCRQPGYGWSDAPREARPRQGSSRRRSREEVARGERGRLGPHITARRVVAAIAGEALAERSRSVRDRMKRARRGIMLMIDRYHRVHCRRRRRCCICKDIGYTRRGPEDGSGGGSSNSRSSSREGETAATAALYTLIDSHIFCERDANSATEAPQLKGSKAIDEIASVVPRERQEIRYSIRRLCRYTRTPSRTHSTRTVQNWHWYVYIYLSGMLQLQINIERTKCTADIICGINIQSMSEARSAAVLTAEPTYRPLGHAEAPREHISSPQRRKCIKTNR